MNNLVTSGGDSGIAQAWLMATVGSKTSYRRNFKRELNHISIPRVCDEVSTIAAEARHLRLTSNLLYGLSLIYKQKVTFMESDLSLIYDRLTTPLFTRDIASNSLAKTKRDSIVRTKVTCMKDDRRFNVDLDLVVPQSLSFSLENVYEGSEESHQRLLAIRDQDRMIQGESDPSEVPAYIAADAQEKSFLEFMDKTMNMKEVSLEECLVVDFEFNQDGEIIGNDKQNNETNQGDFLNELNLDEDFNTVSGSIEDISKSIHLTGKENNFERLDQSRAVITETPQIMKARKRRRLKPISDDMTTINLGATFTEKTCPTTPINVSISSMFHALSLTQPPFLNMCYRMIFGSSHTAGMSADMLPSSSRHPNISNLDSFLKEIDDIERGRDLPSRRPSSSIIDEIIYGSPFQTPAAEMPMEDIALGLEPLSPMLEDTEDEDTDLSNEFAHKLANFKEFLDERAKHIAEKNQLNLQGSPFTLESLIPSTRSPEEESVSRNLAANAVSCLLQLATSSSIIISSKEIDDLRPSKPDEIYIIFN
ncbi:hypothetical protein JCM33374_g3334 [Metschnikowia sp. JCM 33374]|nr:hypothetical protein JCM33374_g3334 [Metschnikowia sp. JCM 33374]